MAAPIVPLTVERLRDLLDYDPATGLFSRRVILSSYPRPCVGTRHNGGYLLISVAGKQHLAHRLAWLHVHGQWPQHGIDHIDGNKQNNAISNLRDASKTLNAQNYKRAKRDNKTGFLGVSKKYNRFKAQIKFAGRNKLIGSFATAEEAHAAYLVAKRKFHEGNTL
jgi:hypothetical protein